MIQKNIKQFIRIKLLFVFMTIQLQSSDSFDSSLSSVQGQYEIALQDLIHVYQSMQPPIQFQFNQSDVVGSTYAKIIRPYVLEINGYSNVVMSAYSRKFPYYSDLQTLQTKINAYQQRVIALSKLFPEAVQQEALDFFYNQLTDTLVVNCAKIVQNLAYALNTDVQDLDSALIAYNLAWAAQTPKMKVTGFADVATFRANMTTWMLNLYEAAISKLTALLQKTNDRKVLYQQIASYHEVLATVYTNSGNTQKAAVEKQNAVTMQAQEKQFVQAAAMIVSAKKQADIGRAQIVMNFAQPAETMTNVVSGLEAFSKAYKSYQAALEIYTAQQDSAAMAYCQAQIDQLQGDYAIKKMQSLWLLFFEDKYLASISSGVKSFTQLQSFYTLNPVSDPVPVSAITQSLTELLQLCTVAPNKFDTSLAFLPLLQSAINSYQAGMLGHPNVHDTDSLVDVATLQNLQKALQDFVVILQGMISIGQGESMISGSMVLAQMMIHAKDMDVLFDKNSSLKNFLFYFPDLETSSEGKKSFQSFVVQYVYRIALGKAQSYRKVQGKIDEQAIMLALSDLITLQNYKNYITDTQLQDLQKSIIALAVTMNIEQYAQKIYKQAQSSNDWQNNATQKNGYQSKADSLWNIAIGLCEIGIDLSMLPNVTASTSLSPAILQKMYVQILQDYVTAFMAHAPKLLGYQLHIFSSLYKLFLVADQLHDAAVISFTQNSLAKLFGGTNGFFAQAKQSVASVAVADISAKEKATGEKMITRLMAQLQLVVEQQALVIDKITHLLELSTEPSPLLVAVSDDVTMTVTMKLGSKTYTAQLTNPIAAKINKLIAQIDAATTAGDHAEAKQDFATAMTWYAKIKEFCFALLPLLESSAQVQTYKDKLYLANTRFTASSLAAQVITQGSVSLDVSLKNIPQNYYALGYRLNNVDMQLLGGMIPASWKNMKTPTVLLPAQVKDVIAIFKAFLISQLLQQQGLTFLSCYSSYQLQQVSGLAQDNLDIMASIESVVDAYIKQWIHVSISASVSGSVIHFVLDQLPIPAVTPLYASGPSAATYFVGAGELFQPGTQLVDGGAFVPGQDEPSYRLMLIYVANAYVSQAQQELTHAKVIAQSLIAQMTNKIKAKQSMDDATFMQKYNEIKKGFIRAQSLLFAMGGSAYYYFGLAGQNDAAQAVKSIFLTSYKTQIGLLQQLLIGNPVSNAYNTVLSDINQTYLSWCAELDPVKDAAQITQNKQAVVQLFQAAGDACMNYGYTQSMFPGQQQFHYMTAASNYQAAKQQYASMLQDAQKASDVRNKALQAYFFACAQKIAVYYDAKQKGLVYTPVAMVGYDQTVATTPTQISFSDLFASYQSFENGGNPNQGKIDAYNDLQNLLLDAAMYFKYLTGVYANQVTPAAATKTGTAKQNVLNPQLLQYLQSLAIVSAPATSISYVQQDVLSKLFKVADKAFIKFQDNAAALTDWCSALYTAIQYQYIDDYQGGINPNGSPSQQAAELLQKWQSFSTALQKESSALENPSSAYIG